MKGFIVVNEFNGALGLGEDNVLWDGSEDNPVTVFSTLRKAINAIKRTTKYAEANGYSTGMRDPWGGQWAIPVKGE